MPHFAGLDHDDPSDLDIAQYREYGSMQGHWMSPDPYDGSYDASNPQSFNRYAYALNNPLSFNDSSGLDPDCGIDSVTGLLECTSYYYFGGNSIGDLGLFGAIIGDIVEDILGFGKPRFKGVIGSPRPTAPNSDPCANQTLAQAGVNARQQIAQAQSAMLNSPGPFGDLSAYGGTVGTGGPNDIKNLPGHSPQNPIDVAAGNISYGITCPFGAGLCQFAAGFAQTLGGNPDFKGSLKTGFDTPADNAQIRTGQAMRAAGCHE
jgi:RHS repeat-associated protein